MALEKIIALYEQAAECDGEVVRPKEPNWTAWANEIRLMCVQDGRTHKQICEMYSRVSRDPFWCRNVLSPSKLREKWDELSCAYRRPSARTQKNAKTRTSKPVTTMWTTARSRQDSGVSMSLLNDVQKFIEAHPGCTSGDIADAFAGYSRQRVLQSASKLRQSGRVAHRCEGDTHRHFPRLTERAQDPEPQPVRETRPVRNFYVGTNDPRVILCLTRQAEELESRAYTVVLQRCGWRHSVKATPSQNETIFWRVVNGVYGKAVSGLHQVKSGISQGITWGLNE